MADVVEECLAQEECLDDETPDAKTLKNLKKKQKKKEKKKEGVVTITAPDGAEDESDESPGGSPSLSAQKSPAGGPSPSPLLSPSLGAAAAPGFSPAARKGDKEKKESAVVRAARERLEKNAKLEEEKLAFLQDQKQKQEEEERRVNEEEAAAEAAAKKKLDAKHDKVAAAKAAGTYMTKAQKLKAEKAAHAREMFQLRSPAMGAQKSPQVSPAMRSSPSPPMLPSGGMMAPSPLPSPTFKASASPKLSPAMEPALMEESYYSPENSCEFRSPVACIMGHVDTGKTKLLDKLRSTNIQQREAGGITQQIGATFFPASALSQQTRVVDADFNISVPGLLMIDTPGHEAFSNLRSRGSSLCDIAIVVIDIMHGLEQQTVESLEMLQKNNVPFIIALNKVDVLYSWKTIPNTSIQEALKQQEDHVQEQFQNRVARIVLELNERGMNASLYWENSEDQAADYLSLVPTSAHTGEGVPDLLFALLGRAQSSLSEQLKTKDDVRCTVIEVKNTEGMGTTIDVLLVTGSLHEGDQIVLAGMNGPIVTTIRALLTPLPMKEMRVKGEFAHHASITTAMGVKVSAAGLEKAVCGSEVFVVKETSCLKELQDNVQSNFKSILSGFQKQSEGVYVKASTIGSLEALLGFLGKANIPVAEMSIGEVHKKDVTQAAIMKEKKVPEYAVILAFDVKVNADAKKEAKNTGVQIFTADIIYNLFDLFQAHIEKTGKSTKRLHPAVFPCLLEVNKTSTIHKADASLIFCEVRGGQLRVGTPICLFGGDSDHSHAGLVIEILKDRRPTEIAYVGDRICIKLQQKTPQANDRDLFREDQLCSLISRDSNETLKEDFHSELRHADWACLDMLKKSFKID